MMKNLFFPFILMLLSPTIFAKNVVCDANFGTQMEDITHKVNGSRGYDKPDLEGDY